MTREQEKFLRELTEVSRRHRMSLRSCGCCSSMWIQEETGDMRKMAYRPGESSGERIEFRTE